MSDVLLKLVLIGDSSVGKTKLIQQWTQHTFDDTSQPTVGIGYQQKEISIEGLKVIVQIWDTAGSDQYRSLIPAYFRGAHAALLVYDITSHRSFESLDGWLRKVQEHAECNIVVLVVGNKSDLASERTVTMDEGNDYAAKHSMTFIETSAKENVNIEEAFTQLVSIAVHELTSRKVQERSDAIVRLNPGIPITSSSNEECNC
jgi:small GTP-binding protein